MSNARGNEAAIAKLAEAALKIEAAIAPLRERLAPQFAAIEAASKAWATNPTMERITAEADKFHKLFAPKFLEMARRVKRFPSEVRRALLVLGQHGWFLDPDTTVPALWEFERALKNGLPQGESLLIEHYRDRLSAIADKLVQRFPHRARILSSAFRAHDRGEYDLSVPVFLAQADGICTEVVGKSLYRKGRKGRPDLTAHVDQIAPESFTAAYLHPLTQTHPSNLSVNTRARCLRRTAGLVGEAPRQCRRRQPHRRGAPYARRHA